MIRVRSSQRHCYCRDSVDMIRAATLLANGLPGENTMLTYRAAIGPAACLGLAFAQAAFADTTVSGTVTNAETGAVIVNARVDVYGVDDNWDFIASVHSDANGRYTWTGDCDDIGPCHLFFSQTGYVVAEASFDPATASSVVNASLHQWPTVSGYVRLADGSPAADVDGVVAGLATRGKLEASAAVAAARARRPGDAAPAG